MNATEEIERLKAEFIDLETESQLIEFDKKMKEFYSSKTEVEREAFSAAFENSADKSILTAEKTYDEMNIKIKLSPILK